jgi:hypothetical protein
MIFNRLAGLDLGPPPSFLIADNIKPAVAPVRYPFIWNAPTNLVKKIGPPKWPWLIDTSLAAQGKAIFARPKAEGGCIECHGITQGPVRFPAEQTWATPIKNVGTDTREYDILA